MKVKILPHPGNSADPENSGVQTSEGDVFAGDVVDLPKDEAGLLIASNRAVEDVADQVTTKRGKKAAE